MKVFYFSAPSCPVVQFEDGSTHIDITDFLISRKFTDGIKYSTVESDARHLVRWLNYLTQTKLGIYQASGLTIERFRDYLFEEEDLLADTANKYIISICAFYYWSQKERRVANMIGWRDKGKNVSYKIIVNKAKDNKTDRSKSPYMAEYQVPFLKGGEGKVVGETKYVPTHREVHLAEEKIELDMSHQNKDLSDAMKERNRLIFKWLTTVGLRRKELVCLEVGDIPANGDRSYLIDVLIDKGTKFDNIRIVKVPHWLIKDTLDYIEYEREDMLNEMKAKFGRPEQIPYLFVNAGNASAQAQMSTETIYSFCKNLGKKLNPHALRRYALTSLASVLYRVELNMSSGSADRASSVRKNVEVLIKNQAGHASIDTTIKYYVNMGISRYLSTQETEFLAIRERELEMELALVREMQDSSIRRAL